MIEFLSSKNVSLFCAITNLTFAMVSIFYGGVVLFFINLFFAGLCYNNYLDAKEREQNMKR